MYIVKNNEDLCKALENQEKKIYIDAEKLVIKHTIWIYSNIEIIGHKGITTIILEKESNCHIISNKNPCNNIKIENLRFEGNGKSQKKPDNCKELAFSCAIYLKLCKDITISNIVANEIRQTGLHFSSCENVNINNVWVKTVGWSILSTYNSNNVHVENLSGSEAGLDIQHSGIHIDGGEDIVLKNSYISYCTGNGIMFDNTAGDIKNFKVESSFIHNCKRGMSLSANYQKLMSNAELNFISTNNNVGIMVANSSNIKITNSTIFNNERGIELHGRNGVDKVELVGNKVINNSENYYIAKNCTNITMNGNIDYIHTPSNIEMINRSNRALESHEDRQFPNRKLLIDKYKNLPITYQDENDNLILGTYDKENMKIVFKAKNCLCVFDKPRNTNGSIEFQANNGIVCLGNNSDLKGRTRLGIGCGLFIGKNLALGGAIDFRLAEEACITIGDDCMFAQKVIFSTDDTHPIFDVTTKQRINKSSNIIIRDHVWIAEGARILKGTVVNKGSVIGMYSFLSHKTIPNNCVAVGNPIRIVKKNIAWEKNFVNDKPYTYKTAEDGFKSYKYYNLTIE